MSKARRPRVPTVKFHVRNFTGTPKDVADIAGMTEDELLSALGMQGMHIDSISVYSRPKAKAGKRKG